MESAIDLAEDDSERELTQPALDLRRSEQP
jgi:hypothetical protein